MLRTGTRIRRDWCNRSQKKRQSRKKTGPVASTHRGQYGERLMSILWRCQGHLQLKELVPNEGSEQSLFWLHTDLWWVRIARTEPQKQGKKDIQWHKLLAKVRESQGSRCELIFQTYAQGWGEWREKVSWCQASEWFKYLFFFLFSPGNDNRPKPIGRGKWQSFGKPSFSLTLLLCELGQFGQKLSKPKSN